MFEKLKSILVEEFNINADEIVPEAELANDLGINSLDLADMILTCEEKFNISIDDEDLRTFITIDDVVKYLEKVTA